MQHKTRRRAAQDNANEGAGTMAGGRRIKVPPEVS